MGKKSGLAFLVGAAAGALAVMFMPDEKREQAKAFINKKTERLQKELKKVADDERVQEVFGKVDVETRKLYASIREEVLASVEKLKKTIGDVRKEDFSEAVDKAVKGKKLSKKQADKVKEELMDDYDEAEKSAKKKK